MNPNAIDLSAFTLKDQKVIQDDAKEHIVRAEFNEGLIVITSEDKAKNALKLHANFAWKKDGDSWVPNLDEANKAFKDVI